MAKIPYNQLIKSMSMFFLDNDIDSKFIQQRGRIDEMANEMQYINHRSGLEEYIRKYVYSLDNILILLGISTEYFKRIISMFRIEKGMEFRSEWSIRTTRSYAIADKDLMDRILTLFIEANDNPELRSKIPLFKLSSFKITTAVMGRLSNRDFMTFLFSKDLESSFNNTMSSAKAKILEDNLTSICLMRGYRLIRSYTIDFNGNSTRNIPVNFAIQKPDHSSPSYYVNYSFQITTSKGQTATKNEVKSIREYIRKQQPEAQQIFVVDGAGWIGRQTDLQDIWDYSTYCLNLSMLEKIKDIIL